MNGRNRKARIAMRLIPVLLVCLALLMASVGCGKGNTTSSVFTVNGEMELATAMALTDNHIESLANTMQVLATTSEVKAGSWEGMENLLSRFGQDQLPALMWFALPDGSYYAVGVGKASGNLSDRSYFPKVMSGEVSIGDLVVSKATGNNSMIATVPVKNDGAVIGALGASVFLEDFSKILVQEMQLPADMVFYAINDQGYIALSSDTQYIMQKASDLSNSFSQAVNEMLSKKQGNTTYQLGGMTETVVYKTSSLTNWCFALGIRTK
jgi:hypothetical protein